MKIFGLKIGTKWFYLSKLDFDRIRFNPLFYTKWMLEFVCASKSFTAFLKTSDIQTILIPLKNKYYIKK